MLFTVLPLLPVRLQAYAPAPRANTVCNVHEASNKAHALSTNEVDTYPESTATGSCRPIKQAAPLHHRCLKHEHVLPHGARDLRSLLIGELKFLKHTLECGYE